MLNNTYTINNGHFMTDSLDDTAWWALLWVKAYDVTGDRRYLDTAQNITDYLMNYVDGVCAGGIWWSTRKQYKNAVTNELLTKLTISMSNRLTGDNARYYLEDALGSYYW